MCRFHVGLRFCKFKLLLYMTQSPRLSFDYFYLVFSKSSKRIDIVGNVDFASADPADDHVVSPTHV
jgi:hypothetical protein